MQWRHLEWRDTDINIAKSSNNWLKLCIVNSIQWLDYLQVVILLLVFINCCFDGSEVLLITQVDMV